MGCPGFFQPGTLNLEPLNIGKRHLKIDMQTMTLASFFVPSCHGGITFPFVVNRPSSIVLQPLAYLSSRIYDCASALGAPTRLLNASHQVNMTKTIIVVR